jgi:transposase
MRRYGLRDDHWERIKELLPGRPGSVGVTAVDNRLFGEHTREVLRDSGYAAAEIEALIEAKVVAAA